MKGRTGVPPVSSEFGVRSKNVEKGEGGKVKKTVNQITQFSQD